VESRRIEIELLADHQGRQRLQIVADGAADEAARCLIGAALHVGEIVPVRIAETAAAFAPT